MTGFETPPMEDRQHLREPLMSLRWRAVLWDDPVNRPGYMERILSEHFGLTRSASRSLVETIKKEGQAVIAEGIRERVEADVSALHGYGLRATLEAARGASRAGVDLTERA